LASLAKSKGVRGPQFGGRKTYSDYFDGILAVKNAIFNGFSNERSQKTRLGVMEMHKVSKICCDHFPLTYGRNTAEMTTVTAPMTIIQKFLVYFICLDKDYKFNRENFQL
jgi:hypothetical protein